MIAVARRLLFSLDRIRAIFGLRMFKSSFRTDDAVQTKSKPRYANAVLRSRRNPATMVSGSWPRRMSSMKNTIRAAGSSTGASRFWFLPDTWRLKEGWTR